MSIEELYYKYKEIDFDEVEKIANDYNKSYEEIVAASIIVTDKEIEEGKYYSFEEVFGRPIRNKYKFSSI